MVYVMSAMSVSSGGVGWGYLLACLPFFPSTRSLHAWWVSSTTFIAYVAPMHLPGEDDGNWGEMSKGMSSDNNGEKAVIEVSIDINIVDKMWLGVLITSAHRMVVCAVTPPHPPPHPHLPTPTPTPTYLPCRTCSRACRQGSCTIETTRGSHPQCPATVVPNPSGDRVRDVWWEGDMAGEKW